MQIIEEYLNSIIEEIESNLEIIEESLKEAKDDTNVERFMALSKRQLCYEFMIEYLKAKI